MGTSTTRRKEKLNEPLQLGLIRTSWRFGGLDPANK